MRAVVDTNILVSALLRADSPPAAVVQGTAMHLLTPVVCDAVMREYKEVLSRPRFRFADEDVQEILTLIEQQAIWVDIRGVMKPPKLPDAQDWPFIACALAAGCPVVTGNVKDYPASLGVRVMTARDWRSPPEQAL